MKLKLYVPKKEQSLILVNIRGWLVCVAHCHRMVLSLGYSKMINIHLGKED